MFIPFLEPSFRRAPLHPGRHPLQAIFVSFGPPEMEHQVVTLYLITNPKHEIPLLFKYEMKHKSTKNVNKTKSQKNNPDKDKEAFFNSLDAKLFFAKLL